MKKIYMIRHSAPFVEIENYEDYKSISWDDFNRNMILSVEGEKNAQKLIHIKELKGIKNIYASDSYRAIGTAKYLSNNNKTKIILEPRINERNLGVKKISELPKDFQLNSFIDNDLKFKDGESINEVYKRFNEFINELLHKDEEKNILVIHGIILLGYLQKNCDFKTDGKSFNINFNNKKVLDGNLTNPDIYEITYDNYKIIDIKRIKK